MTGREGFLRKTLEVFFSIVKSSWVILDTHFVLVGTGHKLGHLQKVAGGTSHPLHALIHLDVSK